MKINHQSVTERQIECLRAIRDLEHGLWSQGAPDLRPSDKTMMWNRLRRKGWADYDHEARCSILTPAGEALLAEWDRRTPGA